MKFYSFDILSYRAFSERKSDKLENKKGSLLKLPFRANT